jgi:hypothetical protein
VFLWLGVFVLVFWLSVSSSGCEGYAMEIRYFGAIASMIFRSRHLACFVIGGVIILFM